MADDLSVSFPSTGVIRLRSRSLFGDVDRPACRRFLDRVLRAAEVTGVTIRGGRSPRADLRFRPEADRLEHVVGRIVALLRQGGDGAGPLPGGAVVPRDRKGIVRYFRSGSTVTGWEVRRDEPGRLLVRNRSLHRDSGLCRAAERALRGTLGVEQYRANPWTSTVRVDYDPDLLGPRDVIEILDAAATATDPRRAPDRPDLHLTLCTASMPIAAASQFAVPAMLPVAAVLLAWTSLPTLRAAHRSLVRERRIGGDVLDSVVVVGCLGTMAIFPGAVLCWCLGLGRTLARRTDANARKLLLDGFGKQPRRARLVRDGDEATVPLGRLRRGDIVVVDRGEVVPVDGRLVDGRGLIDPYDLTGDPAAVEVGAGDRVFAATLLVAGRVRVAVESAGDDTAVARIGRILDAAAGHRPGSQRRAERLAGRAVVPTLALGALGMAAMGPGTAAAVLHRDFGSGLRLSAPMAMLGALARCAHRGILVKDGRALDRMNEVDVVVLDLSAVPIEGRPDVLAIVPGLRARGIEPIAIVADRDDDPAPEWGQALFRVSPAGRADFLRGLRAGGRTVCYVGDGVDDAPAMAEADVSISTRGAASIVDDAAQVVLLAGDLSGLVELRDISRELDGNVRRSWAMIVAPNVACIAGAFAMGLGLLASVAVNNLAALAAVGNGVVPLHRAALREAERRHRSQMARLVAAGRALSEGPEGSIPDGVVAVGKRLASPGFAVYDG